jgi:multidrug efflux pump subunit AcrA (membrane-fusion protein)
MRSLPSLLITCILLPAACHNSSETKTPAGSDGLTPVTVTNPSVGKLSEAVTLNAVSKFLLKTSVKSDVNGYIRKVNVKPGQRVSSGQELFVLRTKESEHLGNTISKLDSTINFSGLVSVKSPVQGFITDLSCQVGDYVQDSDVLTAISDLNSLVFLMELPYEMKKYLANNKTVDLTLPGGEKFKGSIQSSLPAVDPASQTQSYVIHVPGISSIPENLVATIIFLKNSKSETVILPRDAVLTDEIQSEFWIMKMADSSTAIKVPVILGLVTTDKAEIISPVLNEADQILLTGNYGLPDTARVKIMNNN